MDEALLKFSD